MCLIMRHNLRWRLLAALEEGCADGLRPRIEFPGPISEAPIGIIKKTSTPVNETPRHNASSVAALIRGHRTAWHK